MYNKKLWIALAACILLFATVLTLSLVFSGQAEGTPHVVISEILPSNRTYPAPNGKFLDYIEVRNLTGSPTDISGYMLSDSLDAIGYTFPQGTVLPAYGYAVCWCDKESDGGNYAAMGISKEGKDTIYLYNSANVQIDTAKVGKTNTNVPLIRTDDGAWVSGEVATPGYPNTQEGYEAWLASMNVSTVEVKISEVMTGSACAALPTNGKVCDWVELYNFGTTEVVLSGSFLSDDPADPVKWQIPSLTLAAGQRAVIPCVGDGYDTNEANFSMPREGCTVILTGSRGNVISKVEVPTLNKDHSWALQDNGSYSQTYRISPGSENTEAGHNAWLSAIGAESIPVVISEIMTSNHSAGLNANGELADWIELYNTGSQSVDLTGMYLSNEMADRAKWQIPEMVLQPGQRAVIYCSNTTTASNEAPFNLSADGCTVVLSGKMGNILSSVNVPAMEDDRSWALDESGNYAETDLFSPGFENNEQGYLSANRNHVTVGPLAISEVMPANGSYYRQSDGKYYDWVELRNISDHSINLSAYCLSKDKGDLDQFRLPDQTLAPGERVIVICSGNTQLGGFIHAPFTLSREESWLYISCDGALVDYIRIYDVPYNGSVGRTDGDTGTYYFTTPTPGTKNGSGVAFISATPTIVTKQGVYDNTTSVTVEMAGSGSLHYTTDGSAPTKNSPVYTNPITLTKTTSIRLAAYEDGKLRSDIVTASYIINENHTLPVLSLTADPGSFAGMWSNYNANIELPGNLALYENGQGFEIDCGVEMYGHMGLTNPKKSMKVNFRGRYGESSLNYAVYGDEGPTYYESLVVRSGQDYPLAIFRDELFTDLAAEASDNLLVQRYKYCILYVNGRYYGIYCLKEAFSEAYYAENKGVNKDSVEVLQAPVGISSDMFSLQQFIRKNDMTKQENYDYVCSKVNIDSLIDWMIMEGYCTNTDTQQNLRYFRSTETGNKWEFAYYDLDWAWHLRHGFYSMLSPEAEWQHTNMTRGMMKNPEFRAKFLARCGELYKTTLSDENVLAKIDYFHDLLAPEVARERQRWAGSYEGWEGNVQKLRNFVNNYHWTNLINHLYQYIGMTKAEEQKYFGR